MSQPPLLTTKTTKGLLLFTKLPQKGSRWVQMYVVIDWITSLCHPIPAHPLLLHLTTFFLISPDAALCWGALCLHWDWPEHLRQQRPDCSPNRIVQLPAHHHLKRSGASSPGLWKVTCLKWTRRSSKWVGSVWLNYWLLEEAGDFLTCRLNVLLEEVFRSAYGVMTNALISL